MIAGNAHFSAEHALKVSQFLEHDSEEQDYFLHLVSYSRAGSRDLERFYLAKIEDVQRRRREISNRIRVKEELALVDQVTYYSSWHYTAIHMSLFVPKLQTRAALARHFRLAPTMVSKVLDFLVRAGFVRLEGDRYIAQPSRTHLTADSPLIARHHSNWRMKASQSLDEPSETDLHYSLVMSASPEAMEKIREILLKGIQATEPILRESKDEAGYVLALDLFSLK